MNVKVECVINGREVQLDVRVNETLLECLRDRLGLTGTKRGCDQGDCGACTVLVDGRPVNACLMLAVEVGGKEITTIEGLRLEDRPHPLQQAFVDHDSIQCGFCTPGMILSGAALLREIPDPSEEEIRLHFEGHLCRCTGYGTIVKAVQAAAHAGSPDKKEVPVRPEVRRFDAMEKATGDAVFPGDIMRPGILTAKILGSKIAHGRIRRIGTDKALSVPGVAAVITAQDFPNVRTGINIVDQPVMARDKVRYIGEPVAAVAAVDAETAERALDLIELEVDELEGVFDFSRSVQAEAPLIHEDYKSYTTTKPIKRYGNVCLHTKIQKGDIRKGFAESDEIFEDTYTMPVVHQAPLETRTLVAERDSRGRLRLWCSTARPFSVREGVAHALGIPMSEIRVTSAKTGGGFGGKGETTIEPIAAMLALKARRPVKLEMTREEDFLTGTPRHAMEITLKTGVKRDGTFLARQALLKVDTGAYSYFGPNATSNAVLLIAGPYHIPNLFLEGICAYTNKISCGPCRGPGAPQAHFAGETQIDRIARKLGMDPIELRLKNALKEKDSTATGQVLGYVGYREALTQLQTSMKQHLSGERATRRGKAVGIGVAGGFWGMPGMGSSATVRVNEDGSAILSTGAVEIGAGSNTAMALLVSEGLGIPLNRIKVVSGDTDTCPYDAGAIGSRTTQAMGVAVHQAIQGVKNQLSAFAENHLEAPREILAFGEGKIYVMEKPELAVPIATAVHHLTMVKGGPVVATGSNTAPSPPFDTKGVESHAMPSKPFYAFGAQAVAVEVDEATGKVAVLKVIASHNVGKAVFRTGIEGQIRGGVAMGVGYALSEETIFLDGRPLNDSFLDYKVPTMEDVPEIIPIIVEKENASSPEDIRGIGEPSTIPTAAAIANAVYDAVGIRVNHLPLKPERVFWELERKRAAGGRYPISDVEAGRKSGEKGRIDRKA